MLSYSRGPEVPLLEKTIGQVLDDSGIVYVFFSEETVTTSVVCQSF